MKTVKKIALIIAAVVLMAVCFVFSASALEPTGQCGDNVTYTYDSSTKELIISGEGSMYDYLGSNTPFYNSDIKSVIIGDGVTTIGDNAFFFCEGLTNVTVPNSVITIGREAFYNCTNLTSITIPDSVTTIGEYAFNKCTSLVSVTIPDSVTVIEEGTFERCNNLLSVTIPDSVTTIGNYAFEGSTSLENVVIGDYVTTIGREAFYNCTSLTSITIPDSVTTIGEYAFFYCTRLTSATIGDSVTRIGEYAFGSCFELTTVTIPDKLTFIGEGVFADCWSLTSKIILNNVKNISNRAFFGCNSLTNVILGDGVITIGDSAFSGVGFTSITLPNNVTTIGANAFSYSAITSITIPASVTTIGDGAFLYCGNLIFITVDNANTVYCNNVDGVLFDKNQNTLIQYPNGKDDSFYMLPDTVITIGNRAFQFCNNLISVTIPDSVTVIGDNAFANCNALTSVTIPDSVTIIGEYAFWGCNNLISVTIPDSVTTISNYAFGYCKKLISVTIGDSVTIIGDHAFEGCDSLTSITIPDNVTTIGESAFGGSGLTSITIGNGVQTIGAYAFGVWNWGNKSRSVYINDLEAWCKIDFADVFANPMYNGAISNLYINNILISTLDIPDSITEIKPFAFYGCFNLTSLTIPESVTVIGKEAFGSCLNLTSASIGNNITTIDERAFVGCFKLQSMILSDKVKYIGKESFAGCFNLNEFVIPSNVKHIDDNAFALLPWLDKLYIKSMDATFGENINSSEVVISGISQKDFIEKFIEGFKSPNNELEEELLKCITVVDKPIPTGTIYCHAGSTAEAYAIDNDAPYVLTHFFEGEWNYDYDKMIRFRKCIHCDELEVEQLKNTKDEDVEIVAPVNPDVDFTVDVITDYVIIEDTVGDNIAGDFEIVKAFDINLKTKDGVHVQPDGTVKVKLPNDWSKSGIYKVYRVNDDGTLTDMNAYREGSHLVFDTDHFSIYVIVDESEKTDEPIVDNCSCNCHKGGIKGFFFKFILFFQKIFRTNKVCKCGINHY